MKITFVLPTLCLTGGIRVVSIFAELLRERGHSVFVISVPHAQASLRQQVKSLLRGRGWISTPENKPSFFERLDVENKITDRHRPVEDIVVAQWLADKARNEYGDLSVSLVPPTVDTKQFYDSQSRSKQPRGKQSVPTVGLYYSTTPWKGCDLALEAFSIAAKKIPNLRLVAFGSGETPPPYLPLPDGTEYIRTPSQDQIRESYSKCDAWLFASRSEGFGLPIIEAMACGTPVIGSPAGAAPELLAGGGGILLKPEDPEDLAKAIEQICQLSDAEWRAMSENALETVIHYTWEDAANLFEAALYAAVERQPQLTDKP